MDDWDRHLPQVMGAYNSTEYSTTRISPHMMLTGHEKVLLLTFFYPQYEGKKTTPQTYELDVIRRQQEPNDLCRRNTQQAQIRQKRRFDKKDCGCKNLLSRRLYLGVPGGSSTKENQKIAEKMARPISNHWSAQRRSFLSVESRTSSILQENQAPQCHIWGVVCFSRHAWWGLFDSGSCLRGEWKRYARQNDGNEVINNCDLPLDLTFLSPLKHARAKEEKNKKWYNAYGEDFVVDRIVLSDAMDSIVGLDELLAPQEIDLVDDTKQHCIDDHSELEVEFEPETEQKHDQELTKLRVLEWLHDLPADPKETFLTIQDVEQNSIKFISHDNTYWVQLDHSRWSFTRSRIQYQSALPRAIDGDVDGFFVRGVGVGLTHTENLIKKVKSVRRTGELETEGKNAKKHFLDEFWNHILIYKITTQTLLLSQTLISYSRNIHAL